MVPTFTWQVLWIVRNAAIADMLLEDAYHPVRIRNVSDREVVHFQASYFRLRTALCIDLSVGLQHKNHPLGNTPTTRLINVYNNSSNSAPADLCQSITSAMVHPADETEIATYGGLHGPLP